MPTPKIERIEGNLMAVNSFLLHGPDGVVVVDGQLTVSDAPKVPDERLRFLMELSVEPVHAALIGGAA